MDERAQEVLRCWFDGEPEQRKKLWWGKDPLLDRRIGERFGALRDAAIAGALQEWEAAPRSRLALIILVDQFSRNLLRGDPRTYEHDAQARAWCVDGLLLGHDRALAPLERMFFYLPLEHSESLADQERAVALFAQSPDLDEYRKYAEQHRDIVARFGRFPHRNAILGRASTPEEIEFLKQPGSSF